MMPPEQVILFIVGTIIILFGAYFVTYYIGMKASGQNRSGLKNRNIILLDRYAIARDKQFCIVEIAGKVYIVGITNQTMTLLDTIDAAAFSELTENNRETTPWKMTPVGQYGNKLTRKIVAFIAEKTGRIQQKDDSPGGEGFTAAFEEAKRKTNETDKTDELQESQPENPEDD